MKQSHLMIRIDEEVKKEFVEKVEKETGLKASQWVRMKIQEFLKDETRH